MVYNEPFASSPSEKRGKYLKENKTKITKRKKRKETGFNPHFENFVDYEKAVQCSDYPNETK